MIVINIHEVQHLDTEQTPEVRDTLCSDPETAELMSGTGHPCP